MLENGASGLAPNREQHHHRKPHIPDCDVRQPIARDEASQRGNFATVASVATSLATSGIHDLREDWDPFDAALVTVREEHSGNEVVIVSNLKRPSG